MKHLFKFAIFSLMFMLLFAGGVVKQRPLSWSGATTAEISVLDADTSDTFIMMNKFRVNDSNENRLPASLSWIMSGNGVGAGDSVNVTFFVDWSNDQTVWTPDTIGAIPDVVTAAGTTVTLNLVMTDHVQAIYGRVRAVATGADTVTVGGTLNKVFDE